MSDKSEIKSLLIDARNSRRLAAMTDDMTARCYLERVADRCDAQRAALELAGPDATITRPHASELALDRMNAIEDVVNEEEEDLAA